ASLLLCCKCSLRPRCLCSAQVPTTPHSGYRVLTVRLLAEGAEASLRNAIASAVMSRKVLDSSMKGHVIRPSTAILLPLRAF
ncbi:hypothetical protein, partial [Thermogemmatispora sp.]|uniref:hypothetical protein n=1 Tax=Thermogemmatispora sp. TaxID=1968838 RepID=UPI002637FC04